MDTEMNSEQIRLARSLNGSQVPQLTDALLGFRGRPMILDGSDVEHLGAQCLQLLIAAQRTCANDSQPFEISAPSDALCRDLALLGHPIEMLSNEEVAE